MVLKSKKLYENSNLLNRNQRHIRSKQNGGNATKVKITDDGLKTDGVQDLLSATKGDTPEKGKLF